MPKKTLDRLDAMSGSTGRRPNHRERPARSKPVAASEFFTKDANQLALQQKATYVGNGRYSHAPSATIHASMESDAVMHRTRQEATEEYEVVHEDKASSMESMTHGQAETCSDMSPELKGRTQLGEHARDSRATRETLRDEAYERRHREYGKKLKHNSTAYKGLHAPGRNNLKQNTTGGVRYPRNISSANPYKRQSQMVTMGRTLRNNVAFQEFTGHRQNLQKSQE